ncbi:YceI family protein [Salegentibacter salegens]|uniref:YceI-like domain-containing protein n=1 Tax=Salegentibacter salegens TaxID=143223 RepID=A0A1M7LQL6_9FLAO|nr:YceI family protein [Salegentibacter salegens]PRX52229.1 YceI-like domain-containing protein [Salegentibacter salegens]SHM80544.1 YceI-like domain-containing protein [Salegentibacter salegens]
MKVLKSYQVILTGVFFMLLTAGSMFGQNFKMDNSSEIIVEGTSNIHDWEMNATSKQGGATITTEDGKLTGISKLQVSIPAESLESGKGGMDKNAYKALNTKKYKTIEFKLDEVKKIESNGSNSYKVNGMATLKISGVSKQVPVEFTAKLNGNKLEINGEESLNMTNYKIDPPTAMFGTITTGEELTIKFKSTFSK